MFPDQDLRKLGFKIEFLKYSKNGQIYHFGDSGKMVEIFEEMKRKITSVNRNQQNNFFG